MFFKHFYRIFKKKSLISFLHQYKKLYLQSIFQFCKQRKNIMKKITILALLLFIGAMVKAQTLPPTFDLRDYNGENYVTSIKSQTGGTCWTHGAMAAFEGNLMMTGNFAAAGFLEEPNFAEYHLDWWNGFNEYNNDDLTPPTGDGLEVHYGGDYRVTAAYISRGEGPVYCPDANDNTEYDDNWYSSAPARNADNYDKFYPKSIEWYVAGANLENINILKQKIMQYGVMGTCMCYDNSFINNEYEHYQPASDPTDPNHAVSIIGWDDNRVTDAPLPGAWLARNSWGSYWGNGGYFWISYYDKHSTQHPEMGAISYIDVDTLFFNTVYYHDYHGWRDTKFDSDKAFNHFVAQDTVLIKGFNFYTAADSVDYTLAVFTSFNGGVLSDTLVTLNGTEHHQGMHTAIVEQPIIINEGQDFYIYLSLSEGGQPFDRTSEIPVLLGADNTKTTVTSTANADESYYFDGSQWQDLQTYGDTTSWFGSANFCIKLLADTYHTPVSINNVQNEQQKVEVYPNPSDGNINIDFNLENQENVEISVYNTSGQKIINLTSKLFTQGHHTLSYDIGYLPEGVYFISLTSNTSKKTMKVILNK